MSQFVEHTVSANGISIHYYRSTPAARKSAGTSSQPVEPPAIVMLHGITDNGMCWVRVAQALSKKYDLVMPDSRGHGLSTAPEVGYGVDDRAADVAGLIQALDLKKPVLIGHSMGAETAIGVAALYPDLIRGVVLEDPPWPGRFWGSTPEERAERAARWSEDIRRQKEQSREALFAEVRQQHPDWPEAELEPWVDAKQQVSPNVASITLAPRRRWSDYVRQAQCPILLITADPERGAIVNTQTAQEAALFWKNGRMVNIPDAGHCIHREQFTLYIETVRKFLRKIA